MGTPRNAISFSAPKGHDMKAQGAALRILMHTVNHRAQAGHDKARFDDAIRTRALVSPFQGSYFVFALASPRA
jgi:hypothetical protein